MVLHPSMSQSSLAYTEIKYSFTQNEDAVFFQTFMTFFLQWNTKEDINPNVLAALLITKKMDWQINNENYKFNGWRNPKGNKKRVLLTHLSFDYIWEFVFKTNIRIISLFMHHKHIQSCKRLQLLLAKRQVASISHLWAYHNYSQACDTEYQQYLPNMRVGQTLKEQDTKIASEETIKSLFPINFLPNSLSIIGMFKCSG